MLNINLKKMKLFTPLIGVYSYNPLTQWTI